MDIRIEAILQRFPEYSETIMKRIKENDDFESLCLDYGLCINTLKELEKELKHLKLEEYLELKIELEQEVLRYLL